MWLFSFLLTVAIAGRTNPWPIRQHDAQSSSGVVFQGGSNKDNFSFSSTRSFNLSCGYNSAGSLSNQVAVASETVLVVICDYITADGFTKSAISGVSASLGTQLWLSRPGGQANSYTDPVISSDGVVFVGGDDYRIYALNVSNGSVLWGFDSSNTSSFPVYAAPALSSSGRVLFGTDVLYALNASTGTLIWSLQNVLSDPMELIWDVIVDDLSGVIFCSSTDSIAAVSFEGRLLWLAQLSKNANLVNPALSIDRSTLFVSIGMAYICVIPVTAPLKMHKYLLHTNVSSNPAVSHNGMLFCCRKTCSNGIEI